MPGDRVVRALDYWRATDTVVETAERVADAIARLLAGPGRVVVSLCGVRGISSSFANILLQRAISVVGANELERRVVFDTDSESQQRVIRRSLDAVKSTT
ncbi:MAG TPA: hypothetical protein VFS92_01445 [Planctomycetota bacterium]|nr:hypothetical protein [Planctomycetota bacterium]